MRDQLAVCAKHTSAVKNHKRIPLIKAKHNYTSLSGQIISNSSSSNGQLHMLLRRLLNLNRSHVHIQTLEFLQILIRRLIQISFKITTIQLCCQGLEGIFSSLIQACGGSNLQAFCQMKTFKTMVLDLNKMLFNYHKQSVRPLPPPKTVKLSIQSININNRIKTQVIIC